jgi:hypothetical protein
LVLPQKGSDCLSGYLRIIIINDCIRCVSSVSHKKQITAPLVFQPKVAAVILRFYFRPTVAALPKRLAY